MIFVDSNILIDVLVANGVWSDWSEQALAAATAVGDTPVINRVVLAEIAPRFAALDIALGYLADAGFAILALDDDAAFRAGRAHAAYRAAGGTRTGILADFLIGGHASALGATLLTRDRRRFASYFPELTLIAPEKDNG